MASQEVLQEESPPNKEQDDLVRRGSKEQSESKVNTLNVEEKESETKGTDDIKPIEVIPPPPESDTKFEAKRSIAEAKSEEKGSSRRKSLVNDKSKTSKQEMNVSKDAVPNQDSKKSIVSLGIRQSKDIPKDMFTRRKSSRSIGRGVGSIISFRRGSIAEYFDRQKSAKFMNTYKLDSEKPFNVDKVEKILKEVLIEALDNLTYDTDKVPKQAKWASSVIRTKVKEQEYDRYKLICNVTIGEKRSQDMFATYRFLWDAERDKHASYVHENMYVFAVAVCFGIYYE